MIKTFHKTVPDNVRSKFRGRISVVLKKKVTLEEKKNCALVRNRATLSLVT